MSAADLSGGGRVGGASERELCGNQRVNKFVCQSNSKVGKSTNSILLQFKEDGIVIHWEGRKETTRMRSKERKESNRKRIEEVGEGVRKEQGP